MLVFLDDERLVRSLVEGTVADAFGRYSSLSHMCGREPTHEFAHVAIFSWVKYQVPMVGHDGVCQDPHVDEFFSFFEERFEMPIILLYVKDRRAAVSAIDDVIDRVADSDTCSAPEFADN